MGKLTALTSPVSTPSAKRLLFGDVAVFDPAQSPRLRPPVGPIAVPEGFAARFGKAAERYTRAIGRVHAAARLMEALPDAPGNWQRLKAEERHGEALDRYFGHEDRLVDLIRELTGGEGVVTAEWEPESVVPRRCFASITWGGAVFSVDRTGRFLEVTPTALQVRIE